MADSAIILAGGLSKRYGKNKLLETFDGNTLVDYSVEFCMLNEISRIVIVYYDEGVFDYLASRHAELISKGILVMAKRPETPEGTGMSMLTGVPFVGDRFVLLFGDNYYSGYLADESSANVATYITCEKSDENLRYAAIIENTLVEKPHAFDSGNFFAGYMVFNTRDVESLSVNVSARGEVEITDIFNRCEKREIIPLRLPWEEITYVDDWHKMMRRIAAVRLKK